MGGQRTKEGLNTKMRKIGKKRHKVSGRQTVIGGDDGHISRVGFTKISTAHFDKSSYSTARGNVHGSYVRGGCYCNRRQ